MDREQALAKIKKCLALSRSANEHEAAAALRQAQALMREHGYSTDDVRMADVSERHVRARSSAINRWESLLASIVDDAFGCQHFNLMSYDLLGGATLRRFREVVFVGIGSAPEVATYAYDVLARQCAAARLGHVRSQPKSCKPITRTARGDRFAEGWALAVRALIERFAGTEQHQQLIESYMAGRHGDMKAAKVRNTTVGRNVRDADLHAGWDAGKKAQLAHGLPTAATTPRLG